MRNLLMSDRIKLTSVKENDIGWIEEWFNDIEFLRYYDMVPAVPQTFSNVKKLIEDISLSNDRYIFAIRLRETNQIVGVIGFDDIIWSNGVATVFIGIGDDNYIGKGLGRESMKLILDFGFNELNFYRIQLNVISYNESAIKVYESLGFKREGTFREFISRDGKRHDMFLYGLLKKEWDEVNS